MGSGLILLVIVGAWLAVLVPMGLRSHDSAVSSRSPERFSDAMRVLARRAASDRAAARGTAAPDLEAHGSVALEPDAATPGYDPGPRRTLLDVLRDLRTARAERRAQRAPLTLAARRRRVLAVLLGLAALGLAAGVPGPDALLAVGALALLLAVAFVVHCRREAARRDRWRRLRARRAAEQDTEQDTRQRQAASAVPAPSAPAHVVLRPSTPTVTIGTQPPARTAAPAPAETVVLPVVPAAAHPEPVPEPVPEPLLPARRIATREWTPVPVPPPLYVGKAVSRAPSAPAPRRRAAAGTAWSDDPYAGARALEDAPTVVLDTRRAAGDW